MRKMFKFLSALLLCTCVVSTASALTLSSVDGTWSGTAGGSNVTYPSDVEVGFGDGFEDQVRWGTGTNGQSGLGFTGTLTPSAFNFGDIFELGILRHFNAPIKSGTAATASDLAVSLMFTDPAALSLDFNFSFAINETPNTTGTSPVDDDIISFPSSYASETFEIGGIDYTLQILGFGNSPQEFLTAFYSPEGGTNSTNLYARLTTPSPVPEPTTMLLFGTGLVGLAGVSRRKKK